MSRARHQEPVKLNPLLKFGMKDYLVKRGQKVDKSLDKEFGKDKEPRPPFNDWSPSKSRVWHENRRMDKA